MAQEKGIGESWEEIVKAYAKAERELGIKVYCVLCICKKVNGKKSCITPLRPTPRNLTAATVGYKLAHG